MQGLQPVLVDEVALNRVVHELGQGEPCLVVQVPQDGENADARPDCDGRDLLGRACLRLQGYPPPPERLS